MSRTSVYSALVLRSRSSGESNSEITLLTAEEGIIMSTVFGGPKSKLRSHSAPYNSGKVWIYRDPSKDYGKLSDFDVHSWRPGLRELYDRTMAAAGIAESVADASPSSPRASASRARATTSKTAAGTADAAAKTNTVAKK